MEYVFEGQGYILAYLETILIIIHEYYENSFFLSKSCPVADLKLLYAILQDLC